MKLRPVLLLSLAATFVLGVTPADAAPQNQREHGEGTATGGSCPGGTCFPFESSADGTPINNGRFVGRTKLSDKSFTNPDGQQCVWGAGRGSFRKGPNNRIKIEFEGPWCIYAPTPGKGQGRLKGYYKVTGGRGDYAGATGRGGIVITFAFAKESDFAFKSDGTLNP